MFFEKLPIVKISSMRMVYFTGLSFLYLMIGLWEGNAHSNFGKNDGLDVIYQWSQLEFDYSSEHERQADLDNGNFVPSQAVPIDVDVYYPPDNKLPPRFLVTIPRFQSGIPATLGTISNKVKDGNPVLTPYPSWDWHTNSKECKTNRLISVLRVMIDECGRLWVLDTGRLLDEMICPPQLLAFDLKTNTVIHRYEIPSSQIEARSLLATPVVEIRDTTNQCKNTFVYLADCETYSIIVYDLQRQTSWRVSDKTMYPYPNYGTYNIAGDSFDLMDGIIGMSLAPAVNKRGRRLYYHAMSSPTENWVYTSYLRNETLFSQNPESSPEIFNTYRLDRRTQSAAEAISEDGVMFFGLMSDIKIACFNIRGKYGDRSSTDIVADNPITLQFVSGMKIVKNRKGVEELFVLTSRFQKVATGTLDTSEINFRILKAEVDTLIYRTRCRKENVRKGYGV